MPAVPPVPPPASPEATTPPAKEAKESPAAVVLKERTELRESITKIRERADRSAKLIGTVAIALAGYLGVTSLDAIFPLHVVSPNGWVLAAFALSIVTLVAAIGRWMGLLERVGAPIAIGARIPTAADDLAAPDAGTDPNDFTGAEVALISKVLTGHAELNGYATIEQYHAALLELERERSGAERQQASLHLPAGDPAVLNAELQVVLVRACADVVRHRYRNAFASKAAAWAMGLAVAGYVGLALSTAYLAGRSGQQLERATKCAQLVKAQRDAGLTPRELQACHALVPGLARAAPTTPAATTPAPTTP